MFSRHNLKLVTKSLYAYVARESIENNISLILRQCNLKRHYALLYGSTIGLLPYNNGEERLFSKASLAQGDLAQAMKVPYLHPTTMPLQCMKVFKCRKLQP